MRDHAPDPAAWMVDIAGIAGDDMDVAVYHALAGGHWDRPARCHGVFVTGPGTVVLDDGRVWEGDNR
jgi:hypothetical protein